MYSALAVGAEMNPHDAQGGPVVFMPLLIYVSKHYTVLDIDASDRTKVRKKTRRQRLVKLDSGSDRDLRS